jgi:hypothetical protein
MGCQRIADIRKSKFETQNSRLGEGAAATHRSRFFDLRVSNFDFRFPFSAIGHRQPPIDNPVSRRMSSNHASSLG